MEVSKINIDKRLKADYNNLADNLAPQMEGGHKEVSQTPLWNLVDDKGTWTVRVRVIDETTGKIKQKSKSTGLKVKDGTKRAAKQIAYDLATQLAEQSTIAAAKKRTDFGSYVNDWLDAKSLTVRPNTIKSYRDYSNLRILPELGRYPVGDITWRVLQNFCNQLLKDHTKSTVKKYFVVIRGALDDALRDGAIQSNPEHLVRLPREERTSVATALTKKEAAQLLEAVERAGEPIRAAVTLGLCYGLRRSEVCGLRWCDVDFSAKTIHIRHTVTQNGTVLLDDDHTKTKGSNRTLVLIDSTIPYLKQLMSNQMRMGKTLDKVVIWPDGRTVRPDGITRTFQTFLRANKLKKIRFHDLRHTAATLLASAGLPPKQLQAFMGHDDIEMTLGLYTHVPEAAAEDTSKRMSKILDALSCSENCSEPAILVFSR